MTTSTGVGTTASFLSSLAIHPCIHLSIYPPIHLSLPVRQVKVAKDSDHASSSTTTSTGVGTTASFLSSLASLTNQGAVSDPVLAFQSLLALYRREDGAAPSRRKNVPKRIIPSNYNPQPCETKPEGGYGWSGGWRVGKTLAF